MRRQSAREEVRYESDLHCIIAHRVGNHCLRPSSSPEEVLAALAERDKVFVAGDEDALAQLMADDYLQTDAVGHVQDKATWLKEYFEPIAAKIKSGEFQWQVFRKTDLQVRDFGNEAVVIGVQSLLTMSGVGTIRPVLRTA
jgi:ketosteroid isomerase-like protein